MLNCLKVATQKSEAYVEMNKCLDSGEPIDSALATAIRNGDVNIAKFLLQKGGDINNFGYELQLAIIAGHFEMVKFSVENGAKIGNGWLAEEAATNGQFEILKFLIYKGDKIHDISYVAGRSTPEIVKFLLDNGAKIGRGIATAARSGDLKMVELLIQEGGKIPFSAVRNAAEAGDIEIIEFLLKNGAKFVDSGITGASCYNHRKVVEFLLKKGAKILDQVIERKIMEQNWEMVKFLIESRGGDFAIIDAALKGNFRLVESLVKKGGKIDYFAITVAANNGHPDLVNFLTIKGWKKGEISSSTASTYISDSYVTQQNVHNCKVQFHNYNKYVSFKLSAAKETALVIMGHDDNIGAFINTNTIDLLLSKGFNVLVVNAQIHAKSLDDIKTCIQEGLDDTKLTHLFVEMHGEPNKDQSDAALLLNPNTYVNAGDILSIVTKEIGNTPLKVVLSACHGQLAAQKFDQILAPHSEVVTYMEDQVINGTSYHISSNSRHVVDNIFSRKSLTSPHEFNLAQLPSLYNFINKNLEITSPTYTKVGVCKTKSIITITDNEFKEMLSQVSKEKLAKDIKTFICYQDEECNNNVAESLDVVLPLLEESPLPILALRDASNDGTIHGLITEKALAIGNAIYQLYGPCNVMHSMKETVGDVCDALSEFEYTNQTLISEQ